MPKSDDIKAFDLVLKGSVARKRIDLSGRLGLHQIEELSGCIDIDQPLSSLLEDLVGFFDGNGTGPISRLEEIVGEQMGKVSLQRLAVGYRNGDTRSVQIMVSMAAGKSSYRFALVKLLGEPGGFVVGLDLKLDQSLFGSSILSGLVGDIGLEELGLYYASRPLTGIKYDADRDFSQEGILPPILPDIKGRDFKKGLNISPKIMVGGVNLLDWLSSAADQGETSSATPTHSPEKTSGKEAEKQLSGQSTHWIKVDKTIGPFTVKRIGLSYDAPRVGIAFDGGVQLGVVNLTLLGFGMTYPVSEITINPVEIVKNLRFTIDGASICLDMGAVMIGGGLMKVGDTPLRLDGTLVVRAGTLTIGAIGSYTTINGWPSLFIFGALQQPLGGPPFFFIMGLAMGFGINRSLKLPPISDVHNFPLVRAATDPDYLGKELDLRAISQKISDYISPSQGNFWLAAGLKFNSFNLIDVFALASVSIGTGFEIGLLGLAKMQLPRQVPGAAAKTTIASVEMALKVAFAPSEGYLSVEARLTENSYVLSRDLKLRGGFAFYLWFAGPHAGDFVVSIGGYHPKFQPPAHYPRPDRISFDAKLGPVSIKGSCYFSLCSSAIMAGGGFNITYQTTGIKAWLIAQADFLLQWKPLYYDVQIAITVGVAVNLKVGFIRVRLSVELGASVNLYGPPLAGKARISLWIVSFTVTFGQSKSTPPKLRWESDDPEKSFAKAFLPNPKVTRLSVSDGLIEEVQTGDTTVRLVNPHKLQIRCITVVPATAIQLNQVSYSRNNEDISRRIPQPTFNGKPTELGIRPMGKKVYFSQLLIDLQPDGEPDPGAKAYLDQYLECTLVTGSAPPAMWSNAPLNPKSPPDAAMIENAVTGVEIKTKPGPRPHETKPLSLDVLAYDRYAINVAKTTSRPAEKLPGYKDRTIANTLNAEKVMARRQNVIEALIGTGRQVVHPKDIHLKQLGKHPELIFQDMPTMARVGQYPPRGYLET